MKKIYILLVIIPGYLTTLAQSVGLGTLAPNASAQLDISSTDKGLLIPRMGTASIASIANPAKGLLVYDSAKNLLMVNMGTSVAPNWQTIVAGSGWSLTGNGGTDTANNFIGTTDVQPLLFRINNNWAGMIDSASGSSYLGYAAGKSAAGAVFNTGYGYQALQSNTTGSYNTAFGAQSLFINGSGGSIGDSNTAVGYQALFANYGNLGNTAVGYQALYLNTSNLNTAVGYQALHLGGGGGNTAVGAQALYNGGGYDNTAFGARALYSSLSSASYNTATGFEALFNNLSGSYNTASGYQALHNNLSGQFNTAFGGEALFSNTNNSQNTSVGNFSLLSTTGSDGNTALGFLAGGAWDNGYYNVFLGSLADANGNDYYNTIALGYDAIVTAPSMMRVGNFATTSIGGPVGWSTISDGRAKKNIQENVPGLAFITLLRPVSYNLDKSAMDRIIQRRVQTDDKKGISRTVPPEMEAAYREKEQIVYSGFVAQEVEQAAKSIHYNFSGVDTARNDKDLYSLRYSDFVVPLAKSVQELSARNDQLKKDNAFLEEQNKLAMQRIARLKANID
ncbi:MAG TPA: tail fiber domain-containing protein [Puia sp.]|nr:tail fiber domain-containing protein [Puia sp.]